MANKKLSLINLGQILYEQLEKISKDDLKLMILLK